MSLSNKEAGKETYFMIVFDDRGVHRFFLFFFVLRRKSKLILNLCSAHISPSSVKYKKSFTIDLIFSLIRTQHVNRNHKQNMLNTISRTFTCSLLEL